MVEVKKVRFAECSMKVCVRGLLESSRVAGLNCPWGATGGEMSPSSPVLRRPWLHSGNAGEETDRRGLFLKGLHSITQVLSHRIDTKAVREIRSSDEPPSQHTQPFFCPSNGFFNPLFGPARYLPLLGELRCTLPLPNHGSAQKD